jgi:hypothetical protein
MTHRLKIVADGILHHRKVDATFLMTPYVTKVRKRCLVGRYEMGRNVSAVSG